MTTLTVPLWPLIACFAVSCVWCFAMGILGCIGPGPEPLPAREEERPGTAVTGLPRAGRFTLVADPPPPPAAPADLFDTTPLILLSEHMALLDHTGREADRLDAAWRHRYLR